MIARTIAVFGELLQVDGIIVRTDIDMIIQVITNTGKHIWLDAFQGILIKPDISVSYEDLVILRPVSPRSPGVLRINGKTYISAVIPGIIWRPDITVKRAVPLPLKIRAGGECYAGQTGGLSI